MSDDFEEMALEYHRLPRPGKLEVVATKPLANQRDLALAYSPGVAAACEAIVKDPAEVSTVTSRGNLVAVISNGTAVLGLGAIGPLASKPVMEGKAVLFKKFAGIDVFDIEIDETDPEKMCDIIAALEPTFGAINLEDIKAPECFHVEGKLRDRMNIPVFHDDQHGTAIVAGAALYNALRVVGKNIEDVKMVSTGGGAAGIACLNLACDMGLKKENITLIDRDGVIYTGRDVDSQQKADYARDTDLRTLDEAIEGADVFLGLSGPGVLKPEMVAKMADKPIILALANPNPEILPDEAKAVRPDAVIATGRSDYPNQVNNVLCFPFIFRGALDVGATAINEEMKVATVKAIANLAMAESSEIVAEAYGGKHLQFGDEYLIPKPFDPRLIVEIAPAVAKAAMDSGVATRPIEDFDAYIEKLNRFVFRSGMLMKPVFEAAKENKKRLVFGEGESHRVLRACQVLIDDGLAEPILVGRPGVIENRAKKLGLRLVPGENIEVCDPTNDPRFNDYWSTYHDIMQRSGVSPEDAQTIIRTNTTAIAAIMLKRGEADAMICGVLGQYDWHLRHVLNIIGKKKGVSDVSAMSGLVLPKGTFFFADTHVTEFPTAREITETTIMAAEEIQRFGITPKVALISHSNFGSSQMATAKMMAEARALIEDLVPDLECEGEMRASAAINEDIRKRLFPNSRLKGSANLLVMPTLEAANTAFNAVASMADGLPVGPILLGAAKPVHVLTPAVSARGIVNMAAISVVDAQIAEQE